MPLKYYESPFHATHSEDEASKLAMKIDLSLLIIKYIEDNKLTQDEAAKKLGVYQSRISELKNGKFELFTIDAILDMLDLLGLRAKVSTQVSENIVIKVDNVHKQRQIS